MYMKDATASSQDQYHLYSVLAESTLRISTINTNDPCYQSYQHQ